jgi:hypothetical protein
VNTLDVVLSKFVVYLIGKVASDEIISKHYSWMRIL